MAAKPKPPTPRNYPTIHKPYEVPPDGTAPKPGPPKPVPLPKYADLRDRLGHA
jgi:hypothetical protein